MLLEQNFWAILMFYRRINENSKCQKITQKVRAVIHLQMDSFLNHPFLGDVDGALSLKVDNSIC